MSEAQLKGLIIVKIADWGSIVFDQCEHIPIKVVSESVNLGQIQVYLILLSYSLQSHHDGADKIREGRYPITGDL